MRNAKNPDSFPYLRERDNCPSINGLRAVKEVPGRPYLRILDISALRKRVVADSVSVVAFSCGECHVRASKQRCPECGTLSALSRP